MTLRSSERRRVQLRACAAREPCYVATLRPVPRPDPLKRRRWYRSSGKPLTTPPIRPASAPACTSGPETGLKMCGHPGVENPPGRYARSHCTGAAVLEDRGSDGGTATVSWRGRSAEPASGARFFDRGWSGAFPRGFATHRSETHSPPIRVSCFVTCGPKFDTYKNLEALRRLSSVCLLWSAGGRICFDFRRCATSQQTALASAL